MDEYEKIEHLVILLKTANLQYLHDTKIQQCRDRRKAQLLDAAGIPLIYVRYLDTDSRYYRFYTPNSFQAILYNLVTQEKRQELAQWLQSHIQGTSEAA